MLLLTTDFKNGFELFTFRMWSLFTEIIFSDVALIIICTEICCLVCLVLSFFLFSCEELKKTNLKYFFSCSAASSRHTFRDYLINIVECF